MSKLFNIFELAEEINRSVRELRTLHQKGILPHYRLGHRTCLYDLARVEAALARYEVKEVGAKASKRARVAKSANDEA
jgi:hypothetical protein